MYIFVLSAILFAVPILLFSIAYLYNNYKLNEIKNKIEVEKEISKNLEIIYYNILDKN